MKLQYGSTIVSIIFPWINKHDCSFTQKISSTFLFLIFHKIEPYYPYTRSSSQTISTDIKHNFHSLSRIQFFFFVLYRSRNKIKCQRKKGKDYCFTLHIGFIIVRLIVIFKNFNNTLKLILFFASPQSSTLQYLRYHYTSSFHLNHLQLSTIFQRTANLEAGIITPSSSRVTKKTFAQLFARRDKSREEACLGR